MKVYFDESGQTGTHLLDAAQPYFSLGSTNVDEAEAAEILARCFPRRQAGEIKAQKLLRRPQGRKSFVGFAKEVGKQPGRFCAAKIGKRFVVVSKMVDNLVEPLLRAEGYDFYADDYAVRFANSACFVFERLLDRGVSDGLMRTYNAFAREPSPSTLQQLQAALVAAERDGPHGSEVTLNLMAEGARHFEAFHDLDEFTDSNDIHVTSAVQCMGHWQSQGTGPYEVVHDESVHFFRRSDRWAMMVSPDIEPQILTVGTKSLRLPIEVSSTVGARSHESPSLQLCDLVAGFVSWASGAGGSGEDRAFVNQVIGAGLGEMTLFPVDAGTDFAAGPPARASGPDVVDRIRMALSPR